MTAHGPEVAPILLKEGALHFKFHGARWRALKWDEHHAYKHGIERFKLQDSQGTGGDAKGVDFIALHVSRQSLYFMEVKDHRSHKRSDEKEPLEQEFAKKVRDTIAGLMSALHDQEHLQEYQALHPFATALADPQIQLFAILWEAVKSPGADWARTGALTRHHEMRRYLRWLKGRPHLLRPEEYRNIPDLNVEINDSPCLPKRWVPPGAPQDPPAS